MRSCFLDGLQGRVLWGELGPIFHQTRTRHMRMVWSARIWELVTGRPAHVHAAMGSKGKPVTAVSVQCSHQVTMRHEPPGYQHEQAALNVEARRITLSDCSNKQNVLTSTRELPMFPW